MTSIRSSFFEQFLNHFWLRPENALLVALRAESYYSTLDAFKRAQTSVDVSCGDGVFSFVTMGGRLSERTDMFRSVLTNIPFRDGDRDPFDHFDETYEIEIIDRPSHTFTYGTDWKENMLRRAEKLSFYNELIHHDNNNPLCFSDNSIDFVYSNSAYWVANFQGHLCELARVCRPRGTIVLQMKTNRIRDYTAEKYISGFGERFYEIIDAGRLSTWKGLRSKEEILRILEGIRDLRIDRCEPIYGGALIQIWDIGLRPLFNPLVRLASGVSEELRLSVKQEWCEIFRQAFTDFLEQYAPREEEAVEFLIVLSKA